jgi:hypothetical protein
MFLLLLAGSSTARVQDKSEPNFPTDDEIQLVLTQTDRAIQQYKPFIDQEESLMGKKVKEAVAKDREVVAALEVGIKAFRKSPQGFNGPMGFAFFEWIDDADRNALLCASGAANEATMDLIAGDKDKAESLIRLSQGCTDLSNLLYTIGENAGSLYTRYVDGEAKLAAQGLKVATECSEALKKVGDAKPKP